MEIEALGCEVKVKCLVHIIEVALLIGGNHDTSNALWLHSQSK